MSTKNDCGCFRMQQLGQPARPGLCPLHEAAPELLAALESLLTADLSDWNTRADVARAAIAKARGDK